MKKSILKHILIQQHNCNVITAIEQSGQRSAQSRQSKSFEDKDNQPVTSPINSYPPLARTRLLCSNPQPHASVANIFLCHLIVLSESLHALFCSFVSSPIKKPGGGPEGCDHEDITMATTSRNLSSSRFSLHWRTRAIMLFVSICVILTCLALVRLIKFLFL